VKNDSEFYSGRILEEFDVGECLLLSGAESFVFQFAFQKYKDYGIQNYYFACCFVWVRNMVFHIEAGT